MTQGSKIIMSFQGHWNGKFPFIPPSAFPQAALQAGWRHHHSTTAFAWMHMAASYKSRGFTCARPPRSSPSQSTAVAFPGLCAMRGSVTSVCQWAPLLSNAVARCGKGTHRALTPSG